MTQQFPYNWGGFGCFLRICKYIPVIGQEISSPGTHYNFLISLMPLGRMTCTVSSAFFVLLTMALHLVHTTRFIRRNQQP